MKIARTGIRLLAAAWLTTAALAAAAQEAFPNKPVRIVVYVGPGTLVDVTARQIAEKMGEQLGQPVVVENMAGAAGLLGIRYVKRAPADGYTLLAGTNTLAMASVLTAAPGFDLKDFAAVGGMNRAPFVMVGSVNQPATNLAELIANAKARPGSMSFASGGIGTTTFLAASMFLHQAGVHMLHVPYKGTGAAMPDVVGGRINMMFDAESSTAPHIREGRLRAFGVSSSSRTANLPDVPTLAEQGLTGFDFSIYNTLMVRSDTPAPVVKRLSAALDAAVRDTAIQQRMRRDGSEPLLIAPAELDDFLRRDQLRIRKLAADMGMEKL